MGLPRWLRMQPIESIWYLKCIRLMQATELTSASTCWELQLTKMLAYFGVSKRSVTVMVNITLMHKTRNSEIYCNILFRYLQGQINWVAFSVGVHPRNPAKYKRNFAFERHIKDTVLARGHHMKVCSFE